MLVFIASIKFWCHQLNTVWIDNYYTQVANENQKKVLTKEKIQKRSKTYLLDLIGLSLVERFYAWH